MQRAITFALAVAITVAAACTDQRIDPSSPTGPASTSSVTPSATPASSPSPDEPTWTRLSAPPNGTFLVRGRYPKAGSTCVGVEQAVLVARYPGTIRVRLTEDGSLAIAAILPFDRYLEGIAEVPSSWPAAALEAQAIAARSYALATTGWSGQEGETLDEPICATSSCQVYRGIPVPRDRTHRRWVRAVRRTDGLVLLHGDRPATTVYFSTSNGRTYGNEDVFGSDPLPYLRPVVERDDGASPTSHWSVRIPYRDLGRFLARADLWPRGRTIQRVRPGSDTVRVRGGGAHRTIAVDDLSDAVNTWAACLEPRRYPPGQLPTTIPSGWLRLSAGGDALVVTGRGWGHGAGMVQWGAYGKARNGWSAEEILAFYYGGLRPEPFPEPGTIRVVVATGLTRLRIVPSGPGARLQGTPLDARRVVIEPTEDGIAVRA
jgi:stage II sporulation protein D